MIVKLISLRLLSYKMSKSTSEITKHFKQEGHYTEDLLITAVLDYYNNEFQINSNHSAVQRVVKCLTTSRIQMKNLWIYHQTRGTSVRVKTVIHTAVSLPFQGLCIQEVK